jgi:hypothetical protein
MTPESNHHPSRLLLHPGRRSLVVDFARIDPKLALRSEKFRIARR